MKDRCKSMLLLRALLMFNALTFSAPLFAQPLSVGIVPQQAASSLARKWGPLIAHLGEQTGLRLQFATAPSIPEFERRLQQGQYQVAYMNPYHFTQFSERPGYVAIAKARNKRIRGLIVVAKDSPLQSLKQLQNTTLAFPAPNAFAATLLVQSQLNHLNIDFNSKYVSSHDSVYRSVAKGLHPAGGGIQRTLNTLPKRLRTRLRILWTSAGHTPHAIATHPDLDIEIVTKLQSVLIHLTDSVEGRALLQGLRIQGFETASQSDWDDVRALNLNANMARN